MRRKGLKIIGEGELKNEEAVTEVRIIKVATLYMSGN